MKQNQEELMTLIQERVARRREQGDYPAGLEQQLDRHYQEILKGFKIGSEEGEDLQAQLQNLRNSIFFTPDLIETWSKNPLKRAVHRLMAKLTIRQTRAILNQFQQYAKSMEGIIIQVLENQELPSNPDSKETKKSQKSDIDRRLSTALDRINQIEETLKHRSEK